jgi:hypothetical protein
MEWNFFIAGSQILLTLVTAGYGIGLVIADVNKTHVTNPLWTPHARFHVVWQIASYSGFALIAWTLIWSPGPYLTQRLCLVCGFAVCIIGGFLVAYLTMPRYQGSNHDLNGHLPTPVRILGRVVNFDANTTVFSLLSLLLVLAGISLWFGTAVSG